MNHLVTGPPRCTICRAPVEVIWRGDSTVSFKHIDTARTYDHVAGIRASNRVARRLGGE